MFSCRSFTLRNTYESRSGLGTARKRQCIHKTADMFNTTKVTRVNATETAGEEGDARGDQQCGGDSPMQQFPILKGVHSKNPSG